MNDVFAGLVVGGPSAGEYVAHADRYYFVQSMTLPKYPCRVVEYDITATFKSKVTRYRWEPIDGLGAKFGYWVCEDMTMKGALEELAKAYVSKTRANKRRRRR